MARDHDFWMGPGYAPGWIRRTAIWRIKRVLNFIFRRA